MRPRPRMEADGFRQIAYNACFRGRVSFSVSLQRKELGTGLQGIKRKVVYVCLYEAIAIAICSASFFALSDKGLGHATALSIACSAVAVFWNLAFNALFERWESVQIVRGRSLARRVAHALGFEGGLIVLLVPLIAWWLEVSLIQSLLMDIGLSIFFLVYTFMFGWVFDRIFGLPASAA